MINKFWKPNEPISGGKYLLYILLSLFAFIFPPLGMTLTIALTYRRLKTIGIKNVFLAGLLSLFILPILGICFGFVVFGPMDAGIFIYSLLVISLVAFAILVFKK